MPQGFDTCAAPSTTTMRTWAITSPYTSVGVYIGGANRGCAQPNLSPQWINTVTGYGWRLLPIWVGAQAPCTPLSNTTKISYDHNTATNQGILEGTAAADRAAALGLGWLAPVYFDMEAYPSGGACTDAVLAFTIGWTYALHQRGYLAGYYSSLCSGILDVANSISIMPRQYLIDAVWIAAWNDVPNIFGFNQPCPLWDVWWSNHAAGPSVPGRPRRVLGRRRDHDGQQRGRRPDLALLTRRVTASPGSRRAACPPRGRG